jgi:CDP-diacylglycerol--glycerol-3-phosphate 3-phosphatidyltransferase
MGVPNKITICRVILAIVLLVIMMFPLESIGIYFPEIKVNAELIIDSKDIICGIIFLIAALTDFLDGYLARKYNLVTDFGKVIDAIADKILVNGVLILLAVNGYISPIVPVVIVCRDIAVDSIKMIAGQKNGAVAASKAGKTKTAFMLVGITLVFFNDLPFSTFGVYPGKILIMIAVVLSIISGVQYFEKNKKYILN